MRLSAFLLRAPFAIATLARKALLTILVGFLSDGRFTNLVATWVTIGAVYAGLFFVLSPERK